MKTAIIRGRSSEVLQVRNVETPSKANDKPWAELRPKILDLGLKISGQGAEDLHVRIMETLQRERTNIGLTIISQKSQEKGSRRN